MSNIEELKQKIEALEKEVEQEMARIKNEKESKVWKPKTGEKFYYIKGRGKIEDKIWGKYDPYYNSRYRMGNVYKTKAEAQFAREKQIVLIELQRYAYEHNEGTIDWNNIEQYKYCIDYLYNDKKIDIPGLNFTKSIGQIHFTSREIVQNAISEIGEERIKKYLFNVEV